MYSREAGAGARIVKFITGFMYSSEQLELLLETHALPREQCTAASREMPMARDAPMACVL